MQISRLTALLEASKLHAALSNEQVRHWQWLSCRRCPSASQSFPVLALSLALLTVTPAHASGRLSIVGAACMWGLWALPCSVLPPVGDIVAVLPALLLTLLCRAVLSSSWQTCCRVKEI